MRGGGALRVSDTARDLSAQFRADAIFNITSLYLSYTVVTCITCFMSLKSLNFFKFGIVF